MSAVNQRGKHISSTPDCCLCGSPAQLSLAFHLSSLGVPGRPQKTSRSSRLCLRCIQALVEPGEDRVPPILRQALSDAYTAIRTVSTETPDTGTSVQAAIEGERGQ